MEWGGGKRKGMEWGGGKKEGMDWGGGKREGMEWKNIMIYEEVQEKDHSFSTTVLGQHSSHSFLCRWGVASTAAILLLSGAHSLPHDRGSCTLSWLGGTITYWCGIAALCHG